MVRNVETFCGCCEFKVGCITLAVCRVVITVGASVALFVIFFDNELKEKVIDERYASQEELVFFMIVSIPVSIITIRCSYWFIRGATTINKTMIQRMNHYAVIQLMTIISLVICFNSMCVFLALIEFYFMWCSALLIRQRKQLLIENGLNDPETPPPQYDSCVNNTQSQPSTIHPEGGESSRSAGVGAEENSLSTAIETDSSEEARNEPDENGCENDGRGSVENCVRNGATAREEKPHRSRGGEPKKSLVYESEENSKNLPHKTTALNASVDREEDFFKNVRGEPKENLGFESE